MTDDVFGTIFVGTQLEEAVIQTLHMWMPDVIKEIELQLGREVGLIQPPRLYTTRNQFNSYPEDQMPMCVVVSPGLASAPTREGDGTYSADFHIAVGMAAAARDADASGFLAKLYGAAARWILLNKGGRDVAWEDESYDDLVNEEERVVRACYNLYRINVWDVVSNRGGPASPTPGPDSVPGSQWPSANTITIDIEAMNLEGGD